MPVVALELLDLLADRARLFLGIPARGDLDLLARLVLGTQRLAEPALVVGDEMRSGGEDVAGGAIIALEANDLGAGKVVLEAQDVIDLGAAPAVDRLVVIADAADIFEHSPRLLHGSRHRFGALPLPACGRARQCCALPQQPQPEILRHIGVLVLVDQHVAEAGLILAQHLALLAEKTDALEQEVAEVGGVEDLEPLLIGGIALLAEARRETRGLSGGDLLGREAAVLPAVEKACKHARRPALLVDILRFQELLEQADLIVLVENGKVGLQAHQFRVPAQDFYADRMEGAEPGHAFDNLPDHGADARFHFPRGLVGESDRKNLARARVAGGEDVGDARGQYARLAGAGAGEHQHRSFQRLDRQPLLRIEIGEIGRGRCRPRALCDAAWPRSWGVKRILARHFASFSHSSSVIDLGALMPARGIAAANLKLKMALVPPNRHPSLRMT